MQSNINIKDKELSTELKQFQKDNYPDLPMTKLFVRALVEKMKREKGK